MSLLKTRKWEGVKTDLDEEEEKDILVGVSTSSAFWFIHQMFRRCAGMSLRTTTIITTTAAATTLLRRAVNVCPALGSRRTCQTAKLIVAGHSTSPDVESAVATKRWKPLCLYHTQGQCTMVNDAAHLEKFNHNFSNEFEVNANDVKNLTPQHLDYFLVLDLEGKVEILEFPVVMISAKTMEFVDSFHRFVRPTKMSEQRIHEYIEGKYGKLGIERVWHDTAVPFRKVLQDFELWLTQHCLWQKEVDGSLHHAAFVTCGNWDIKTKIPQQCTVSGIEVPSYFKEWINLKDVYLNFYRRRATGMMTMMRELGISMLGSHHLGIDDAKNIAKVLQHMLSDGARLQITARRSSNHPGDVEFFYKNRIR